MEPLNLQAVSRLLFDNCMEELFEMLRAASQTKENLDVNGARLLSDEENALR